jgi:transposase
MDNLGAHKVRGVREAIEAVGASVLYLPTYSPDMNPIELWWPDLKRQIRRDPPRELAALTSCVRRIRSQTPVKKVNAWIDHALSFHQVNRSLG